MSEQNIEVVKRGYEAFSVGNAETVMSQFDDNLEWVHPGESTLSGIYRGKSEFGEYLGRLAQKAVAVRALSFIADGDTVVAFTEVTAGSEIGEDADVYPAPADGGASRLRGCIRGWVVCRMVTEIDFRTGKSSTQ